MTDELANSSLFTAGDTAASVTFFIRVQNVPRAHLGPGGRIVLGRGVRADVTCSREHVELVLDRFSAHPRFRDLKSQNGISLRGRRVEEGFLVPGDTLAVGPYLVTAVPYDEVKSPALIESRSYRYEDLFDVGPEFASALGPGEGDRILRKLGDGRRTGTLVVELPDARFEVVFARGMIVRVRGATTAWTEAIEKLIAANAGLCRFQRGFELSDAAPVDVDVPRALLLADEARRARSTRRRSRAILVVEDDHALRRGICEALDDEGFRPIEAHDGADAITKLGDLSNPPGLILLDLEMPGMDGWELRRWLGATPRYANVPVIVVSGVPALDAVGRLLGVEGVLSKPVSVDAVLTETRRHVRPRR